MKEKIFFYELSKINKQKYYGGILKNIFFLNCWSKKENFVFSCWTRNQKRLEKFENVLNS